MPGETHPSSLPDLLGRAVARHQAGDFVTATRLYLEILQREPRHFEALHRLGVARTQAGDAAAAVRHLTAAIAVNPQSAEAHVHLAHARMAAGETEAALASYDQALALRPQYPEALYSCGNALQALQRHAEAVQCYDRALALAPDRPEILTNRGNALHDLKRLDEALADYDRALALRPDAALLHNNRGNTLRELRRHAEALAEFDRALALDAEHLDACVNRGNVLQDLRRHQEALAEYDRALARNPRVSMLHSLRAGALHDLNRYADAVESYQRALQLGSENPKTIYHYAVTLRAWNRHEEAAVVLGRLLALAPDWKYAQGDLFHSRAHCCEWAGYASHADELVQAVAQGRKADTPLSFLAVTASAAAQRRCAEAFAAENYPASATPLWTGVPYAHDRIRVAYVSADFREHPVSRLMAGVFERHDRRRFEIFGFSLRPDDSSPASRRVRAALGSVVDVTGKTDAEIAGSLRDSQIDIAVDLMGYTLGSRGPVFAHRPAPVQVNYLGFPGTMGAPYMDYLIADAVVVPPGQEAHYAEKIVYLPECFQANDDRRGAGAMRPTRSAVGLPGSGFVFCCFNNSYKITPFLFERWLKLLQAVPGSVLWLFASQPVVVQNLRAEARRRGADPGRLVFAEGLPYADYLARMQLADLFLDTSPFNGGTTASDALWAGVPVLTCPGEAFASRMAGSLLNAIGLPELVTHSLEEYESLALELARNPQRLADFKSKLAQNRGTYPLFDTDRFRRHIEAAYVTMWQRYQRGEPPASFAVEPIDNWPPMKKRRSERADPQRFDALLDLGILKAQGGLFQEALQLFNEALRINPQSAEANLNLGNVLAETGRAEEALASYDKALAIRPAFADALYCRGNALQALKRHEEALESYDRALAVVPGRTEIMGNRGNTLHDLKRYEEALASYEQAIAIMPRAAFLHNNRGDTLRELNRFEEALASLDRALAIAPDYVDALNNRGNTLQDLRRCEEALASFDRALAVTPDDADLHNNRGNTLRELKRPEEALASYDRAIAIMPGSAFLHNNRGNTLRELGRHKEALASLDIALALKPGYVEALTNRGNTLRELGRHEEALASFDLALVSSPDDALVLHNRGNALQDLRRYEEALASYENALAINPAFAEALHGRGNALHKLRRFEEALACYEKALMIRPDLVEALRGRAIVLEEFQRYEEALASYRQALAIRPDLEYLSGYLAWARMRCCEWRERDEEVGRLTAEIRAGKRCITPFMFLGVSDSPQDQLLCSRIWVGDQCAASPVPIWKGERYRHERIRVAYVSADFRAHPSSFLLAGMFEHHDRSRFETIAISFGPDDRSEIRTRVKGAFEDFIDVRGRSDLEVARLLREREVDIAVDLTGHTQYDRMGILALRPAPVQVNFFCPGTSGADFLDYIICDRVVIPEDHHPHYTEKVVYLPDTFQANDSKRRISERTPSRAETGLPESGFVFCSFNNTYKFTPGMFDIWVRLLGRVEGSVLWLQQVNETAVKNLRREAIERGIDAKRLIFAPRVPRLEDHLARYRLADLFLDTLPYNAQTTASDALWAGLPVITCLGTTFVGRVAASLLNAIGLPELITHSLPEYEALALELATNRKRLADIKSKLAENRNTFPLFDTDRFRRHIEAAYTTMWERYQRGEAPESFAVDSCDK